MDAPSFTIRHRSLRIIQVIYDYLPQRIFEGLQSQLNQHQPHGPSSTDSLPRNHPRFHTRHQSSRSLETISAMLLLVTECLAQETSNINLLKFLLISNYTGMQSKDRKSTFRANELGLYKIQLDIGQAGTLAATIMKAIWFI